MRRFGEVDSTNRVLLALAREGAPAGTVVVADHQTAGRGRLGRTWLAPPGSALLVSVLLRPDLPPDRLHLATAAVALAARQALIDVTGVAPGLKWPNDLVVDDRKIAGVLAEAEFSGRTGAGPGPAVVVGLGVNLNWPAGGVDGMAPDVAATATAVNLLAGRDVDRDAVLDALLDHLGRLVGDWTAVASAYRRQCVTLGRVVRVQLPDETFTGTAADVSDDGHLLVDVGMCLRTVTAGDVVHLRPIESL